MDPNKVARFIGGVKLGTVQPHCPGLGPCHVRRNGRNWARFAWALHNGPVPDGMHVLHNIWNGKTWIHLRPYPGREQQVKG